MILVPSSVSFISSNFLLNWLAQQDRPVVNLDKLTNTGIPETLVTLQGDPRHVFVFVARLLAQHSSRALVNSAAKNNRDWVGKQYSGSAA